jgi:hypothetical protein
MSCRHARKRLLIVSVVCICLCPPVALIAIGSLEARGGARGPHVSQPFAVAELFVELNDTDHDLGLHAEIDGGTWTQIEIEDARDRPLLGIISTGRLRSQGLTQLAFESAEPTFEELDPEKFFRRFPEGVYEISALAQGGGEFESRVRLSHVLAAPVQPTVNGLPSVECDAPTLPEVAAPVFIDWDPVTESHPEVGATGPVTISRYQFFVQQGDSKLSLDLLPSVTEFEIPTSVTAPGGVYKFEIIARTSTGNNTAVEACFRIR